MPPYPLRRRRRAELLMQLEYERLRCGVRAAMAAPPWPLRPGSGLASRPNRARRSSLRPEGCPWTTPPGAASSSARPRAIAASRCCGSDAVLCAQLSRLKLPRAAQHGARASRVLERPVPHRAQPRRAAAAQAAKRPGQAVAIVEPQMVRGRGHTCALARVLRALQVVRGERGHAKGPPPHLPCLRPVTPACGKRRNEHWVATPPNSTTASGALCASP